MIAALVQGVNKLVLGTVGRAAQVAKLMGIPGFDGIFGKHSQIMRGAGQQSFAAPPVVSSAPSSTSSSAHNNH